MTTLHFDLVDWDDFIRGRRAARISQPFDPRKSLAWIEGYRWQQRGSTWQHRQISTVPSKSN